MKKNISRKGREKKKYLKMLKVRNKELSKKKTFFLFTFWCADLFFGRHLVCVFCAHAHVRF